jgi:hypothetical protein
MSKVTKSFYTRTDLWTQIEETASAEGVSASAVISRAVHEFMQRDWTRSSWDTQPDDEWYDERRFYTYSQDKKGHSVTVHFAIPKNMAGAVKRIVDSGSIPELRSAADFYRNAIFHWARKVAQWVEDDEFLEESSWHQLRMEDDTIRQASDDFQELMIGMKGLLDSFLVTKDYTFMESYLTRRDQASSIIPEKFRAEYLAIVDSYRERLDLAREGKLSYLE